MSATETYHDAIVTVWGTTPRNSAYWANNRYPGETFSARVRSRYTYEGRPMFLADRPQQAGATSVRPPDQKASG